jgi:two-component system phosphate regulon response regulator PhoB
VRRDDILVVEDDGGIRQTLVECLELEGYPVRAAGGAEEAIAEIGRRGAPGLILLDLVMPGMSGAEMLRWLRQDARTAAVPVVLMTAALPPLAGPVPDEADALLAKPFELAELLATVERFVPARALGSPPAP